LWDSFQRDARIITELIRSSDLGASMNWRHSVVVSVACGTLILGLPINKSNAAEKSPFFYFILEI
jgi:hypothetical protein